MHVKGRAWKLRISILPYVSICRVRLVPHRLIYKGERLEISLDSEAKHPPIKITYIRR